MGVNGRSKRDHHDVWWSLLSIRKIGVTVLVWHKPERPTPTEKVTFWCGVSKLGTVGPNFFFNKTEQVDTVNSQRYVNMIEEFTIPQFEQYNYNMDEYYSEGEYYYPNLIPSLILQTRIRSVFIGPYFVDNTAGQFIILNFWLDDSVVLRCWWNKISRWGSIHFKNWRPTNSSWAIFIRNDK